MEMLLSNPEVPLKRKYAKRGIDWTNKEERHKYIYASYVSRCPLYYCECCKQSMDYNSQYKHKASAKHLKNLEKLTNTLSN